MSALDDPEERPDGSQEDISTDLSVTVEETELTVSVPADATKPQAAAIVSAIGAHVSDRQRATAAAAAETGSVEYADDWKLTGRLERFGKRRRPRNVERGDEWKAAARARY